MESESFPCYFVSWNEAYLLAKELSRTIKHSDYRPDLIIAIGRGGYVPARVVCDFLLHNLLTSMKVEHWGIAAHKKDQAVVRFPLAVDVKGLKVLILDDVTDTGDTLQISVNYVESLDPTEIRTGVLQHKTVAQFQPDYYAEEITEWKWIIYPWAAHEDLVGFAERVISKGPLSILEIQTQLKKMFQLAVDEADLKDALEDLLSMGSVQKEDELYKTA